jgi:hypothetical protein
VEAADCLQRHRGCGSAKARWKPAIDFVGINVYKPGLYVLASDTETVGERK